MPGWVPGQRDEMEVVRRPTQVVEVVAVHVPREHLQPSGRLGRGHRTLAQARTAGGGRALTESWCIASSNTGSTSIAHAHGCPAYGQANAPRGRHGRTTAALGSWAT